VHPDNVTEVKLLILKVCCTTPCRGLLLTSLAPTRSRVQREQRVREKGLGYHVYLL
jgi:hypothetical protein